MTAEVSLHISFGTCGINYIRQEAMPGGSLLAGILDQLERS